MKRNISGRRSLGRAAATTALALLAAANAQAALQGRDLDPAKPGFEAYYDTELDLSWIADFGLIRSSGFDADGRVSWSQAQSWIATLNADGLYGYADWRLPRVAPVNGGSFQLTSTNNGSTDIGVAATGVGWGKASEMGHLYYVTLANKGLCTPTVAGNNACTTQPGWEQKNTGPFANLGTFVYWSGTPLPSDTGKAWYFYAYYGNQDLAAVSETYSAVAVRSGDVLAVPEPRTAGLMLAGLATLALALRGRRRR